MRRRNWVAGIFGLGLGVSVHGDPVYDLHPAVDYPVLAAGSVAGLSLLGAEWSRRHDTISLDMYRRGDLPAFDAWAAGNYSPVASNISTVLAALEVAAPALADGTGFFRNTLPFEEAWTDMVLYGEALSYSCALSVAFKFFAVHPRPLYFNGQAPLSTRTAWDTRSSFFSTHTTAAFAAAVFGSTTFQARHPDSPLVPWIWGGALSAATAVAALRVASGEHYPSDVVVGAAVGSLCGYLVPLWHRHRADAPKAGSSETGQGFFSHPDLALQTAPDGFSPMLVFQLRN